MKSEIIPFYTPSQKIIECSADCFLYDEEGKEYIDFESGVWCANIGHNCAELNALIKRQIEKTIHHGYRFRNRQSEQLSVELQQLIGFSEGGSVFLSSGSEAVNLSITLAKKLTGRKKFLKIDNSYLSAYGYGLMSIENEFLINVKMDDMDELDKIDFQSISAVLLETGGASLEMVRIPSAGFINELCKKAQENSCLIIAEEVTTGMGRMGKWFGFQNYDVIPDIVVTGKALGNGFSISGMTVSSAIYKLFMNHSFIYAQSHQNDPFGCAIALKTIKIIKDRDLITNAQQTGDYFKQQLEALKASNERAIKEVRGMGLMLAVEFHDFLNILELNNYLFDNGFVVGCKLNALRFLPPLIIQKQHIDQLIFHIEEFLKS